ncbi:MAG: hypothetical protein RLZ98_3023 [Pseudomonadota bacterium]|jgi:2-methylcitrate dehydratase
MVPAAVHQHPTALEKLAAWTLSVSDANLPAGAYRAARLLLLDTVGCALAGWHEEVARGVAATVCNESGAGRCQVIGNRLKVGAAGAVLLNGVLARVLDLNDYVANDPAAGGELGGHPSDNISVALAAAEISGCCGRDLLAAVVVGYEVFARAAALMEKRSSWDRSSVSGLVAPAMAGRLLGLGERELAHALALSAARCATSAMVRSGDISAAKSLANALVAENGYRAVELARHGITGPLAILEHPNGMREVFTALDLLAGLDAPMPDEPYIMRARIKAYPCVATSQSLAAAAIALHARVAARRDEIERIVLRMADYPVIRRHQSEPVRKMPDCREAADHSFPFVAVVGMLDGAIGHGQFENERWAEPLTRALMERVEMTTDPDLNARSSAGYPARIEVSFAGGETIAAEVLEPPGGGAGGLDEAQVLAKFERTTEGLIDPAQCRRIIDAVMSLEGSRDCSALIASVAVDVGA